MTQGETPERELRRRLEQLARTYEKSATHSTYPLSGVLKDVAGRIRLTLEGDPKFHEFLDLNGAE